MKIKFSLKNTGIYIYIKYIYIYIYIYIYMLKNYENKALIKKIRHIYFKNKAHFFLFYRSCTNPYSLLKRDLPNNGQRQ